MHKLLLKFALLLLPVASLAATTTYKWNIPDNVRIVQTTAVDNVRTFSTITAAVASIQGPSATNPFLVKVMPGVYSEATLTVPAFVRVEGSGMETTIFNGELQVHGAIGNMTANTYTVLYDGSTLDRVHVSVTSYYRALTVYGNVSISDSIIEGTQNGIGVSSGALTLKRSKVAAYDAALYLDSNATMGVQDSELRATQNVIFANQQLVLNVRGGSIVGSTLLSTAAPGIANFNFGGTQLQVNYSMLRPGRDRTVNCYDGSYLAIPDLQ